MFVTTCHCHVNMGHIGCINPIPYSQNSFIYEILCLFAFCLYLINITESTWKCVTRLVKKQTTKKNPICVKILHADVRDKKAALVRNYFFRRNYFCLCGSQRFPLSHLMILDQFKADVLFRRVKYPYLETFMCPIVFQCPVSTWPSVNGVKKCSLRSIRRSVVGSSAPPVCMLKLPLARSWTPNCSRWLFQRCVNMCVFELLGQVISYIMYWSHYRLQGQYQTERSQEMTVLQLWKIVHINIKKFGRQNASLSDSITFTEWSGHRVTPLYIHWRMSIPKSQNSHQRFGNPSVM